jgi:hypothetical protein
MKVLFKERVSKFGSLVSLIAITGMLALFFLALPETLVSASGRIFAAVWALAAILVFTAHARRLSREHRHYPAYLGGIKVTSGKKQGERRFLRG